MRFNPPVPRKIQKSRAAPVPHRPSKGMGARVARHSVRPAVPPAPTPIREYAWAILIYAVATVVLDRPAVRNACSA